MKKIALPDYLPEGTIGADPIRESDYIYPTRDGMELHVLTDNSTSEGKKVNILPLSFDFKCQLAQEITNRLAKKAALLFLEEMTRPLVVSDVRKEIISFMP
ncbi:hypothetical protein [Piscirickettsia salmonis]|uniref:hypothetical protein n=1 Tax=Piscirickettsia salmonis TaxID=1238 RepID=UPI0007C9634B|nr:hypothetical protein A0O36_01403 [Piscirickettsiaceae bacterium NZ-RLO1]